MPDLERRTEFEERFRRRLAKLRGEYRQRILDAMGTPPDPAAVPESLWLEMEERQRNNAFWLLLLVGAAAYSGLHDELDRPLLADVPQPDLPDLHALPDRPLDFSLPPLDPAGEALLRQRAQERASDLSAGILATDRQRLAAAAEQIELAKRALADVEASAKEVNDAVEQILDKALGDLLRPSRHEAIAVTEVTGAITAGERALIQRADPDQTGTIQPRPGRQPGLDGPTSDRQFGQDVPPEKQQFGQEGPPTGRQFGQDLPPRIPLGVFWRTERDERVCPICGPLHGTEEAFFAPRVGGPPVHPRCRCWLEYRRLT